ncbi:MAG: PAS domain S-box protein [Anaerolineales bacterium]|nr:PAS domain S-box protein [Anaerolineales bacterium]
MPPSFWIDAVVCFFSMLIATSLALLVISSGSRRALNWLFAAIALLVVLWHFFSLLLRAALWLKIGDPELMLELATLCFSLLGPSLLLFIARYAERSTRWSDLFAVGGLATTALLAPPLFLGRLIYSPQFLPPSILSYQISPLGAAASLLPLAFLAWCMLLCWQARRRPGGLHLMASMLFLLASFVAGALFKATSLLVTIASAVSVLLLGYTVISQQIFNPYKQRTNELEREIERRQLAEQALQDSEAHFRSIFENAMIGIYRTTPEGRVLMANPAVIRMAGYVSFEKLAKINLNQDGFSPESSRSNFIQRIEADGRVIGLESTWKRSDGSTLYVRESARAIRDPDGRTLYYEGTVEDITERIQAEQALQRSLAELQNIQQITEALLNQSELYETMNTVARGVVKQLGFDMVLISRYMEQESAFGGLALYPLPESGVFNRILELTGHIDIITSAPAKFKVPYRRGENPLVDRVLAGETIKSHSLSEIFYPWFSRSASTIIQGFVGLKSFIDHPMRVSGKTVGTIVAAVRATKITAEQEQALARLADQAAVALEKARLLAETQQQLQEQIALRRASAAISSALEPQVVLNRIAEQMGQAVDATSAYICSCDVETISYHVLAEYIGPNACKSERISDLGETYVYTQEDRGFLGTMLAGRTHVSHINSPESERFEIEHMRRYGAQTILYIPLFLGDTLIGIAELWETRKQREFTTAEIALCQSIAHHAAAAIQNARLHEQVLQYAQTLETRVAERTAQLETANKELQTFAYSVSHDLRAPLRSIDGFSAILLEDYSEALDEEGREHLRRVRRAVGKMSTLIDDILRLSRVTRREIQIENLDMSALVRLIADELKASQPERTIGFNIQAGVVARGDRHLVDIALRNLLENAVKFTAHTRQALITFSAIEVGGKQVYYVRDNGAGFNMAYQDKLFIAFQRLHADHEFPGSGVGLSIVYRVIQKHHGEIWAEAEEGQGATFYFTLG